MTKSEIKELTDIIMKADVYRVSNGGHIDKSKKHEYLFVNSTGTRHYEFAIDADTVEEAKKISIGQFYRKIQSDGAKEELVEEGS